MIKRPSLRDEIFYRFYTGKLLVTVLRWFGRVPCGYYLGWGHWMTLKEAQSCVGPGWASLVKACFNVCLKNGIRIDQIKEKFGGLRFYIGSAPKWIWDYIAAHEDASRSICEDCGREGRVRNMGGWLRTLCSFCAGTAPHV
jgi:hypothetical protein